jgi:hypothetical protein
LSGALSGGAGDTPPPPGDPNPVSVSLKQSKRGDTSSKWRLVVQSNEHTPDIPFPLIVLPSISLAGEKMIPIKNMDLTVTGPDNEILGHGVKPELEFNFERGSVLDLNVSFENPGQKNYVVRCNFVAAMEDVQ